MSTVNLTLGSIHIVLMLTYLCLFPTLNQLWHKQFVFFNKYIPKAGIGNLFRRKISSIVWVQNFPSRISLFLTIDGMLQLQRQKSLGSRSFALLEDYVSMNYIQKIQILRFGISMNRDLSNFCTTNWMFVRFRILKIACTLFLLKKSWKQG